MLYKYFIPFCGLLFYSLTRFFWCRKVLITWSPICLFLSFVTCTFGVISKKSLPNLMVWSFILCFLFRVLLFSVRVQLHSFVCGYPVFPALFVGKTIFFPLNGLGAPGAATWSHKSPLLPLLPALAWGWKQNLGDWAFFRLEDIISKDSLNLPD